MEELGLLVNEALFIGNSTVDVIAGRKAKVKTFLLADDDLLRSDLNKESVRTINNLEEILEILNEH